MLQKKHRRFFKSNRLNKDQIFKKQIEKGEFYFFNKPEKKIKTL